MNKSKLKSYAPQARNDFIAMVTSRANQLGISESASQLQVEPCTVQGEVALIGGQAYPAKVAQLRQRLLGRIKHHGFGETMEAIAYTWFNRFAALRYMELHDYLGHGQRVLSSDNPDSLPDILTHALELVEGGDLPGISRDDVAELKLAGKDGELYKRLLVAQCNKLASTMPFLFERIDDDSELLLPDNLLRSDSVIAKLVEDIPVEDWAEVEIIGWLYQFYISEKKDQVIGKVVKSEDIPAATQLFTPNWIVQYLVQNSVGRLWLMANPQSALAREWPYYITPAEQAPEVQDQLDALIQTRVREDGDTLNPESITVLDPACGSGHILVVAYDVLKAIYLERGYQPRAIPRLILEKNLFGLDIDDRAAQMAGFALLMKARADDRRLFTATDDAGNLQPPKLNVLSLQESKGLSVDELTTHLAEFNVQRATITALVETFEHAKTFGSLIQIPYALKTHLAVLPEVLAKVHQSGDMYASAAADDLLPLVQQAQMLAMQFDAVVANPPYMGNKGMNLLIKDFAKTNFLESKYDLFAMFIERGFGWCRPTSFNGLVTMQSWMFLSSYEQMRNKLLNERTIHTMAHLGARAFSEISGEIVQTTAFILQSVNISRYRPVFFRLLDGLEAEKQAALKDGKSRFSETIQNELQVIPGSPIAYWVSPRFREIFARAINLDEVAELKVGMATSDNERFLRHWHEVSLTKVKFNAASHADANNSKRKWFPYSKGGEARKWFGNNYLLVNWENEGKDVIELATKLWGSPSKRIYNSKYFFKPAITWSLTSSSSGGFCARWRQEGFIFDVNGMSSFVDGNPGKVLCAVNSKVGAYVLGVINPTMAFQAGDLARFPYLNIDKNDTLNEISSKAIQLSKADWDSFETSWDFSVLDLIPNFKNPMSLDSTWRKCQADRDVRIDDLKKLEEENNRIFIEAYGLQDEITPEVPESQLTLTRADREKDCQRLISYAIGCMMGRYSLDEPGLIYAHAGNVGFEPGRYTTFPADADGIVPITDELWLADDAPSRIREFLRAVWGPDTLEENMVWLAESLGTKASETPDETIRRYIADKFFKDHLQTYKKRPIYWLFSSGKQGAFQALVYLHRYHEGTLARMRAEYVVPLTGKMAERIKLLEDDVLKASTPAARKKIDKDIEKLKKKLDELRTYDEKLRHYADMRISLDLDDGVKVNYGKFGDLLAEVKSVTGGSGDD